MGVCLRKYCPKCEKIYPKNLDIDRCEDDQERLIHVVIMMEGHYNNIWRMLQSLSMNVKSKDL